MQFDLTAGIGDPPIEQGDIVLNVSRISEYLRCPARFAYRYLENRVVDGPEPRYLKVGRVVHKAIERLHTTEQGLDEVAAAMQLEFDELIQTLDDEKHREQTEKEAAWAQKALAVYDERVRDNRFGWRTIVSSEEPMWLRLIQSPNQQVYIVGTPDKIVVGQNDKLRHVQFKTMSAQVDPSHFAMQTRFSLHETVYGFMIEGTYGESMDLPYQGTELIMLPKVMPPKEPVNRTKDGRETEYFRKQMDKYRVDQATWADRVVDRRMLALGYGWRRGMLNELADSVMGMEAMRRGVRPYTRAGGGACNRYGGACGYLAVCSGEAALDGSGFTERGPDYVDEMQLRSETGKTDPGSPA